MSARPHHLTVNGRPWCEYTACQDGRDIDAKAGGVTCGHPSGHQARKAAADLRPHFKPGAVRIVASSCPSEA